MGRINSSIYSSNKPDWSTPNYLFDLLNTEFNFTIDVCANELNKKCNAFYSIEEDGLSKSWNGIIWMNPPYGRGIDKWIEKAYKSSLDGCICVCLVPVRSDTKWWHKYVMKASEIRFLTKRLSFEGSNNKAPFPAAIVIFKQSANDLVVTSMNI